MEQKRCTKFRPTHNCLTLLVVNSLTMISLPTRSFENLPTPFYYYDEGLLRATLDALNEEAARHPNFIVHYATKANANLRILQIIKEAGLGVDCVSGGEIETALRVGFKADNIVFAGVGKSDWEIKLALENNIFCFNVESIQELEVIEQLCIEMNQTANVCLRVNPNVNAHTHKNITTGLAENKFGIPVDSVWEGIEKIRAMKHVRFIGLHFHIGSQIVNLNDFRELCSSVNSLLELLKQHNIEPEHINVGGGLGIDYDDPTSHAIPDFKAYFEMYAQHLQLNERQKVHFELGRSLVGQCGYLVSRVLYVKQGQSKRFLILDAGMNDLLRPALYHAKHQIVNLSNPSATSEVYDVVGPVCESSDIFSRDVLLPQSHRGDLMAICSAGAYGEAMASQYNCRQLPKSYLSDDFNI